MYYEYFKYCLEHKLNVFKVCWKKKQYWHALTHDLSKFSLKEFSPYARYFYGEYGAKLLNQYGIDSLSHGESCYSRYYLKAKQDFDKAWEHHYLHNKHHWDYWCYDVDAYYKNGGNLEDYKLKQPRFMPPKHMSYMVSDWEAMSLKFGGTAQEYYLKNYSKIKLNSKTRYFLEYELELNLNDDFLSLGSLIDVYGKEHKWYLDKQFEKANKKFNIDIYELLAPQLLDKKESDKNGGSET